MPRRLGEEVNEMKFWDNISGCELMVYYGMPSTEERVAYANECYQRKRNKVVDRSAETRQKYGVKILKGVRSGDFEKKVNGAWVPIISDQAAPEYDPEWKAQMQKYASDIIELLAIRVFDAPVTAGSDEEEAAEEGEDAE